MSITSTASTLGAVVAVWIAIFPALLSGNTLQSEHVLQRTKRSGSSFSQTECAFKYQNITSGHTACLPPSQKLKGRVQMGPGDRVAILAAHNQARRNVNPTARRMTLLVWDEEIAVTAIRWAENCYTNHDAGYKRYAFGRFSVGQNLAWASYKMTWAAAIKLWEDEKTIFTFGGSNSFTAVGHYTQVVWDQTYTVGCGAAECKGPRGSIYYYVCNYGPAGNFDINNPYQTGPTCGDCPGHCNNGLCDCGGQVCYNGGELDVSTCQCKCVKDNDMYVKPSCDLNCTGTVDPRWCKQFDVTACEKFANIPYECPHMCGWCPAAAFDFRYEGSSPAVSMSRSIIIALLMLSWVLRQM